MKHIKRMTSLLCAVIALTMVLSLSVSAAGDSYDELADSIVNSMFKPQVWIDPAEKPDIGEYAYSFVAVGDTQIVCESYPEHMATLYDWIVDNVESKKIAHVFGLGDITNHTTNAEWQVAKQEIAKLDGVVPYSLIRGNHDKSNAFNKVFGTDTYKSQFAGFYEDGKLENSWRTFSVADVDYLFITMDYGPSDAILNWAGEIIKAHPHHRVIISTHAYMTRGGVRLTPAVSTVSPNQKNLTDGSTNNGQQMWNKLFSKYENIFMVLSGHVSTENVELSMAEGVHGNTVYQFLIDPQGLDATIGAMGMVAILYFSEDGRTVTVEQYSTVRQKYYRSTSQFSFNIPEYAPHSFTNYVPDGNATCLENGTETAKCDGCDKTDTREAQGGATGHQFDPGTGLCACGEADPNWAPAPAQTEPVEQTEQTEQTTAPEQSEQPTASVPWGNILAVVIPGLIFFAAVMLGYMMGKHFKRKRTR